MWEFASAIRQALEERDFLVPDKSGCGFAVGKESLPSSFAARGVNILATDLSSSADAERWAATGQHAANREVLFAPHLVGRSEFDERVRFRNVDMRNLELPWGELFDFVWSYCAIEHLGTLEAGLDFVVNSLQLVRPGGIAVHTTEFKLALNDATLTSGQNVVYRKRDIEQLDYTLRG